VFSRKARPLSVTTHHHVVFLKGTSSASVTTHHHVVFSMRHVPPCYQSQLIMPVFSRRHVPAISHNIIITARFSRKGTSLRAINHNSSSRCVFTKGARPSGAIRHIINVVFSRKARPPCYQSQLTITLFTKGTSSANTVTTHHVVFSREGATFPGNNHNSSSQVLTRQVSSSVLSITTHHQVVFSRRGTSLHQSQLIITFVFTSKHVPPCYQSQLIIMQVFLPKGIVPPCYQSQLIMLCFRRHVPPCYQSQLIIKLGFKEHVPPCYQSQLIIIQC
jgi:hypothetical protein